MNLWHNLIHQISAGRFASARRFVAGGGADLGSSTGSWRAIRFVEQNSLKLLCGSFLLAVYGRTHGEPIKLVFDSILKSDKAMKKAMEEEGVTRIFITSKIAEFERKTESLSASEHDRSALQIYKEWLRINDVQCLLF